MFTDLLSIICNLVTDQRACAKLLSAYEAALRVYTEADYPADWAMNQNNLGTAYSVFPVVIVRSICAGRLPARGDPAGITPRPIILLDWAHDPRKSWVTHTIVASYW